MTPLQKALKEKAVLEGALEMAVKEVQSQYDCFLNKVPTCSMTHCGHKKCIEILTAHFKAKAQGGR